VYFNLIPLFHQCDQFRFVKGDHRCIAINHASFESLIYYQYLNFTITASSGFRQIVRPREQGTEIIVIIVPKSTAWNLDIIHPTRTDCVSDWFSSQSCDGKSICMSVWSRGQLNQRCAVIITPVTILLHLCSGYCGLCQITRIFIEERASFASERRNSK